MTHDIVPLTPDLWPAFEALFGKQGACYGCWCTHFRLPPAARRQSDRQSNKEHIKARIDAGPPPGLLAIRMASPTAGCRSARVSMCPSGTMPAGPQRRRRGRRRDPAVWAISCFPEDQSTRARADAWLVAAGIDHARRNGARRLEACPIDLSRDSRSLGLFVGSTRVFEKAGFPAGGRRARPGRPLMRLEL